MVSGQWPVTSFRTSVQPDFQRSGYRNRRSVKKTCSAPASKGIFGRVKPRPKNFSQTRTTLINRCALQGKNRFQNGAQKVARVSIMRWLSGLQRKPRRASILRLGALTPHCLNYLLKRTSSTLANLGPFRKRQTDFFNRAAFRRAPSHRSDSP